MAEALDAEENLLAEPGREPARASRTSCRRSRRESASSSRPRRRRSRSSSDEGRPSRCPGARTGGRRRRSQGPPELSLPPQHRRGRPARWPVPHRRGRRRVRASARVDRDHRDGDRAELDFEPSTTLWAELAVGADRCAGRRCPYVSTCFAEAARERAGSASWLSPTMLSTSPTSPCEPARTASDPARPRRVVFDEAHRLEEAASWFGGRISLARLQLARDVERYCREQSVTPPARALAGPRRSGADRRLRPGAGRRRLGEADRDDLEAKDAISRGRSAARRRARGQGEEADALARRALAAISDLEACVTLGDPDRVMGGARRSPGHPWTSPRSCARRFGPRGQPPFLVSATLEARFLRDRLGLDEAREVILPSPFDYREQALVYVPARFPSRARRATTNAWPTRSSRSATSRAAVRSSSRRPIAALDALVERASPRLSFPVLVQGDAPRERLLERFRDDVDSVLFATATFWQGVDVQGESSRSSSSTSSLRRPGDPLVEARCERIAPAPAGTGSASTRCHQRSSSCARASGASSGSRGRGRRRDPRLRLHSRSYGSRFLEALPPAPLVVDRAAVAEFFGTGARATA